MRLDLADLRPPFRINAHTTIPAAHARLPNAAAGTGNQREQPGWAGHCSLMGWLSPNFHKLYKDCMKNLTTTMVFLLNL
jgi:hypothetical protein